jgi:hypothetical protein
VAAVQVHLQMLLHIKGLGMGPELADFKEGPLSTQRVDFIKDLITMDHGGGWKAALLTSREYLNDTLMFYAPFGTVWRKFSSVPQGANPVPCQHPALSNFLGTQARQHPDCDLFLVPSDEWRKFEVHHQGSFRGGEHSTRLKENDHINIKSGKSIFMPIAENPKARAVFSFARDQADPKFFRANLMPHLKDLLMPLFKQCATILGRDTPFFANREHLFDSGIAQGQLWWKGFLQALAAKLQWMTGYSPLPGKVTREWTFLKERMEQDLLQVPTYTSRPAPRSVPPPKPPSGKEPAPPSFPRFEPEGWGATKKDTAYFQGSKWQGPFAAQNPRITAGVNLSSHYDDDDLEALKEALLKGARTFSRAQWRDMGCVAFLSNA